MSWPVAPRQPSQNKCLGHPRGSQTGEGSCVCREDPGRAGTPNPKEKTHTGPGGGAGGRGPGPGWGPTPPMGRGGERHEQRSVASNGLRVRATAGPGGNAPGDEASAAPASASAAGATGSRCLKPRPEGHGPGWQLPPGRRHCSPGPHLLRDALTGTPGHPEMPRKAAGGPCLRRQVRGAPWPALQPSEPASSPHGGEAQSEEGHRPPTGLEQTTWHQVTYRDVTTATAWA